VRAPVDFATPHMEQVLRFIGIDDIAVHSAKEVLAKVAA
jgi:FMN-dependent NADH-azoreductase